jgi:aspartate/methionine/tyrosine aminotransferase
VTRFSERSRHDPTPNALARAAAKFRDPILDLTLSNPTRADLPYDEAAIRAALAAAPLRYDPTPFGLPAARAAVAADLGAHVDPDRVVLTASTSEAYGHLFKLLCDPGDEVLVPQPSYPLFEHLARLDAVRTVPYPLRYAGRWHLDTVRPGPRTRAVLVVHPNNPTGSYLARDEADALAALGLPIVADQVFARYPLVDDRERVPDLLRDDVLTFTLGGLSKLAGLPQLKLGWIVVGGPEARVREALARLELIADTYLSVGTPVQHALPALLAARRVTEDAIRARTRRNLARLQAATAGGPVSVLRAEGGWYAVLQLPRTRTEEEWALTLLERDGVLVHPGHFYDFEREAYAVVSLLPPEPVFDEAVARLVARVQNPMAASSNATSR